MHMKLTKNVDLNSLCFVGFPLYLASEPRTAMELGEKDSEVDLSNSIVAELVK